MSLAGRTLSQFSAQSWVGKAKFAMQGLIHEVEGDGKKEMEWTKLKSVPEDKVVMRFEGSWRGEIKVTKLRNDKVRPTQATIGELAAC